MPKVEIYTSLFCGYCHHAKKFFTERGIEVVERDVLASSAYREEMQRRTGGRTSVPQIFIDDRHIGGWGDLQAMDRAGKLASLLGKEPS